MSTTDNTTDDACQEDGQSASTVVGIILSLNVAGISNCKYVIFDNKLTLVPVVDTHRQRGGVIGHVVQNSGKIRLKLRLFV